MYSGKILGGDRLLYYPRAILITKRLIVSMTTHTNHRNRALLSARGSAGVRLLRKVCDTLMCLEKIIHDNPAAGFPHRVRFLAMMVCGVSFWQKVMLAHTGMPFDSIKEVSATMRAAVLAKLSTGYNAYVFARMLMLKYDVGPLLSVLPDEIKSYFLSFLVQGELGL